MNRRRFLRDTSLGVAAGAAMKGGAFAAGSEGGRIRIGQIGTRHAHAAGKMQAMRKLDDLFEIVGVVEPDAQRREAVRNDAAYAGLDWLTAEQLLDTPGLQAVAVETEVDDLVPTARKGVAAGMHVHLDKPAGQSLSAYRELLELAETKGRIVQMGYMLRYNPAFAFMFKAVREGWLGEIFEIHASMGKVANASLRRELARYDGAGMFELACHLIDAAVYMMGRPEHVVAFNRSFGREPHEQLADNQLAVLVYEKATAAIRCSHVDPLGFGRRHFTIAGTKGAIEIAPLEPPKLTMTLTESRGGFERGRRHEVRLPEPSGRYDDEFRDLAAVIRGEHAFAWSHEHDLATHETVLLAGGAPLEVNS